jgi:hypothetical protein
VDVLYLQPAPIVNRACRTRCNARAAAIANLETDYVVTRVVFDGTDGTSFFTCIATNANRRVNQMLERHRPQRKCRSHMLLIEANVFKFNRQIVDTTSRRSNPVCELS